MSPWLTRLALLGLITTAVVVGSVATLGMQQPAAMRLRAEPMSPALLSSLGLRATSGVTMSSFMNRWFGTPRLFVAPVLPDGTVVEYFDISGRTQNELIASLRAGALCSHYQCLADPGAPPGGEAWGLQGGGFDSSVCYSPASTYLNFSTFIVIPRWQPKPYGIVDASLVVKWNALVRIIYTHEARHAAIAVRDFNALREQARRQPSCAAYIAFMQSPSLFAQLNADQLAYHAQLRADCRPELGCAPPGFMGWHA